MLLAMPVGRAHCILARHDAVTITVQLWRSGLGNGMFACDSHMCGVMRHADRALLHQSCQEVERLRLRARDGGDYSTARSISQANRSLIVEFDLQSKARKRAVTRKWVSSMRWRHPLRATRRQPPLDQRHSALVNQESSRPSPVPLDPLKRLKPTLLEAE